MSLSCDQPVSDVAISRPVARSRRPSLTDRLERFLSSRIGSWVSVDEMADVVGHSGVRERRRECEARGIVLQRDAGGHGEYRNGAYGFVVLSGRKDRAA